MRLDGSVPPPAQSDDVKRVAALRDLCILDTSRDARFDRITKLVSELLDVPIVIISLVDRAREWFKSTIGTDISEIGRDLGFCTHGILQKGDEPFTVVDALQDRRFATHPFVVAGPKLRFYSGAPLISESGFKIGMLCVHDIRPRPDFGERQKKILSQLAHVAMDEINFHHSEFERKLLIEELSHRIKNVYATIGSVARASLDKNQTSEDYVSALTNRISAMAAAHDHLIENSWAATSMMDIVKSVTRAHHDVNGRFVFDLAEIEIDHKLTQTFALCIHELLTNSIKYGALNSASGQVALSSRRTTDHAFHHDKFVWREVGGAPPVLPSHRGFGHRMIEAAIGGAGGKVQFHWHAEGLACEFELVSRRDVKVEQE